MIWLNTSFSARQCAEVAEREGVDLLVYDTELAERQRRASRRWARLPSRSMIPTPTSSIA